MTTLNGKTPDLAAENIEQLRQIFPDVFEEGKIDFDKLKQALGEYVDDEKERYNFTWNGKGKALRLAQTPTTGTLRPCVAESKNWDDTQNLYIEGDNLEVLKLLQKSYHGKIKMIYIDPPYNTGGDFIYPDDFSDSIWNYKRITGQVDGDGRPLSPNTEANGRYHTDWLNMMYSRLRLARNLLCEDGAIFVSVDDNEITNIRRICDEIFGENNFFCQIVVQSNKRGQTYKQISKTHEYLLIYTKTESAEFFELEKDGDKNDLNLEDNIGPYNIRELRNRNPKFGKFNRPGLFYPIYIDTSVVDKDGFSPVSLVSDDQYTVEVIPLNSTGGESCWRWGKELASKNIAYDTQSSNLVAKRKQDGGYNIYEKYRKTTYKAKSIWDEVDVITEKGTVELGELGLSKYFDFPKPVALLKKAISIEAKANDIILDFFSGSATTAHAVMQLNAEDGGSRKFIMVQLPEPCAKGTEAAKAGYKNICEIGKERIRRAGAKIKDEIEEQNAQLKIGEDPKKVPDIGFKVFKLDSSNLKKWQPDYDDLEATLFDSISNYVEGRSELDVVYEIMLKMGMELTWPLEIHSIGGKNVYDIGMGALMICLDDHITTEVAEGMVSLHRELSPETWRVVFKDNGFEDDSAKVNIKEILKLGGLEEGAFTTV